jgi:hypothetical protein
VHYEKNGVGKFRCIGCNLLIVIVVLLFCELHQNIFTNSSMCIMMVKCLISVAPLYISYFLS